MHEKKILETILKCILAILVRLYQQFCGVVVSWHEAKILAANATFSTVLLFKSKSASLHLLTDIFDMEI
jgi:hypothetical protein